MYQACIFDLDGTLLNTLASIADFGNRALARMGCAAIEAEAYRKMVGNGADLLMRRMLKQSKGAFSEQEVTTLRRYYDALYEGDPLHLVIPYVGIPTLLEKLSQRGIKTAVLSNKPDNVTAAIIHGIFGYDQFLHVQGQLPKIPKKPDPTAARGIVAKMELTTQQVLYIGDSGVDMETGNNANLDTAGVLWGFREEEELRLHGAKFLVRNAMELEQIIFS